MNKKQPKTIHEAFTRFFEQPRRETLRDLLREHVGELRNCDFKEDWPEFAAVARHLLGLANSGGGCLVLGVKENPDKTTSPQGLPQIKDKAEITNGIKNYVPHALLSAVEIADFKYDASEYPALVGKLFQVVFIHARPEEVPFVAQRTGNGIRAGAIYVRREGVTEEANNDEVQALISQRVAASPHTPGARSLKEHLEELKVLYGEIPRHLEASLPAFTLLTRYLQAAWPTAETRPNPDFPPEDYQAFVRRMVDAKKTLIEILLGIQR